MDYGGVQIHFKPPHGTNTPKTSVIRACMVYLILTLPQLARTLDEVLYFKYIDY